MAAVSYDTEGRHNESGNSRTSVSAGDLDVQLSAKSRSAERGTHQPVGRSVSDACIGGEIDVGLTDLSPITVLRGGTNDHAFQACLIDRSSISPSLESMTYADGTSESTRL
jgi:hypothetical protein